MPAEDTIVSLTAEPSPSKSHNVDAVKKTSSAEHEIESMKPTGVPIEVRLGDGGARQAELIQASWGKHGKIWVFFGLGLCMLA